MIVALRLLIEAEAQMCPSGVQTCPTGAPYRAVTISADSTHRIVATSTCPPYDNPGWQNPASACDFDTTYRIPLISKFAQQSIPVGNALRRFDDILYLTDDPRPILGVLGVFMNGVNIFGVGSPCGFGSDCPAAGTGAPSNYVDAVESEGHTTDQCGGHASPMNQYHIHSGLGLNTSADREACGLPVDTCGEHSELLGWIFDGFGLYGRYSQGGLVPTDLDECGGHTHKIDGVMTYHYHIPDGYPWIIGCLKGCPEVSNNPMELTFANSNPAYGCPTGLDTDPNPVIEPAPSPIPGICPDDGGAAALQAFIACTLAAVLTAAVFVI